ncbi:bifunctional oligoribonuclease/PAP phosphatase NrnA [Desulfovibrio sp. OttesenSCG-928-F20]|nr:bifunctional oligoribonuclease/PAP phosphatase NrnA [Desulfovibrio sp. OttesenSCG-928-F20]
MTDSPLQSVAAALKQSRRLLAVTHVTPDGDAVGSCAAVAHIALFLGGEARILLPEGLPKNFSWLKLPTPVVRSLADLEGWTPDLVVFLDCGDAHRAGSDMEALVRRGLPVTVNIDHHKSNPRFAHVNWVESERAATGELLGLLAEELGMPLSDGLGQALYLALATDTGNFTYANTSAESLAMAARIVGAGLDVARFTDNNENNWNIDRMHLWGRLMSEIELHAKGAIACGIAPRSYLDECGLGKDDLEGFASWLRRIRGVQVSLFIREDAPGHCKISLRSMGGFNVQAVAALYGGGGHVSAAGAEIALGPEETKALVLAELEKRLKQP